MESIAKVNIMHPVDADHVDIQKDPFHPAAYVLTLPLDSEPSYIWSTLFQHELWSSLDFWDRKVLIVGKTLKLVTTPDGVPEKLLWLDALVTGTNKRVENYNRNLVAQKDAKKAELPAEDRIRKDLALWPVARARTELKA